MRKTGKEKVCTGRDLAKALANTKLSEDEELLKNAQS
jgi:hypothetical protein